MGVVSAAFINISVACVLTLFCPNFSANQKPKPPVATVQKLVESILMYAFLYNLSELHSIHFST